MLNQKESNSNKFLTKNIIYLSIISFFTDIASEILYPIIPIYLQSIGYGALAIGFIEGIADAISGLGKGVFGYLSDKYNNRTIFIKSGYILSAITKPLIGLTTNIFFIFTIRLADRAGKGIRSAPRDAILALESSPQNRGKVFGFHRSLDTFGAMLGPVFALIFLFYFPSNYTFLFFLAFIPGLIASILTFFIKDKSNLEFSKKSKHSQQTKFDLKHFNLKNIYTIFKTSSVGYKKLLIGFLLLAVLNSSDMFLILRAKELGMSDIYITGGYILYNFIFAISAFPLGFLSDKFGFKKIFIIGLIIFALSYTIFSMQAGIVLILFGFGIYGIFAAANDGISKAWLSQYILDKNEGSGLGIYMSLSSAAFLIASVGTGFIWEYFGSQITFSFISASSVIVVIYFLFLKLPAINIDNSTDRLGCNSRH